MSSSNKIFIFSSLDLNLFDIQRNNLIVQDKHDIIFVKEGILNFI